MNIEFRILLDSFRYCCHFARQRQDLELAIRSAGVVNGAELIANLKLLRDEIGHKSYSVLIPPVSAGCFMRGDAVPPFRTHRTDEGDYDSVYQMEKGRSGEMKSLEPVHRYVTDIIYRVHVRIAERQKREDDVGKSGEAEKVSELYASVVKLALKLREGPSPGSRQILQKEWVPLLVKTLAVSKWTALDYTKRLANDGLLFVDRSEPRRTLLIFNDVKLRSILGSGEEVQVAG